MGPVDGPLNISWKGTVSQADCEWILGLCNDGCGGPTSKYYQAGNIQSGG